MQSAGATAELPDWLEPLCREARERFSATGFPSSRDEEWRFTPVGPIAKASWRPAPPAAAISQDELKEFEFGHPDWSTLVFVNGSYREELSRGFAIPGVRVISLAEALRANEPVLQSHLGRHAPIEASPFAALNTAMIRDGGLVHVAAGTELLRPIHLLFVTTPEAAGSVVHPRNLIVVERGARAAVVESYVTSESLIAPTGPIRSPKCHWAETPGWNTPGSSAKASKPTTSG